MNVKPSHATSVLVGVLVLGAVAGVLVFRVFQGRAYKALVANNDPTVA